MSYAQLSKFNLDRVAMNDARKRKNAGRQYNHAMETSQRVVQSILTKDNHQINNILSAVNLINETMKLTQGVFQNGKNFSTHYKVVDLFSSDDTIWKEEKKHIMRLIDEFSRKIYTIDLKDSVLFKFYVELKEIFKVNENNESEVIKDVKNCLANSHNQRYATSSYSFYFTSSPLQNFTAFNAGSFNEQFQSPSKKYLVQENEDQIPLPMNDNHKRYGDKGSGHEQKEINLDTNDGSGIGDLTSQRSQSTIKKDLRRKEREFLANYFRSSPTKDIGSGSGSGFGDDNQYDENNNFHVGSGSGFEDNNNYDGSSFFNPNPSYSSVTGYMESSSSGQVENSGSFHGSGHDDGGPPFPPHPHYQCDFAIFFNFERFMKFMEEYNYFKKERSSDKVIMEINKWKIGYNNMITNIFENSYIDVEHFQEHKECLRVLGTFDERFENDLEMLPQKLIDLYECYGDCTNVLQNLLTVIINFPIQNMKHSKILLSKCDWVKKIWIKETGGGRYSNVEGAVASVSQHSQNIKTHFKNLVKNYYKLPVKLHAVIPQVVEILESYKGHIVTKEALALNITSRTLDKAIMDVVDSENKIKNSVKELGNSMDLMWTTLTDLYEMILDRNIPMIKPSGMLQLEFPKIITTIDPSKENILLNTMNMNDVKYIDVVVDTFQLIFKNYPSVFENVKAKQIVDVLDLVSHTDEVKKDLQLYLASLKMDKEFTM